MFDINKLNLIEDYPNKQFFKQKVKQGEIHKHWETSQKDIRDQKKVKFLKTHNSLITAFGNDFTKPEYSLGVIYVIRDPRNVITSVKNHNDLDSYDEALKFMQDENKVLEDYPHLKNHAKTNIVNSWRINYRSWLSNKSFRRVTIRYEDMVKNPTQTFEKLVVFVNTLMRFDNKIDQKNLVTYKKASTLIEEKIQKATFVIENPLPLIKMIVKEEVGSFHVVAGSFSIEENSYKRLNELKSLGYNSRKIGVNKYGLFQVAYASFNTRLEADSALLKIRKDDNVAAWILNKELN